MNPDLTTSTYLTTPSVEMRLWRSTILDREFKLYLYLPPRPQEVEPLVLYLHDGQNLFSATTAHKGSHWALKETLDRLIGDGTIPPVTIVGVGSDQNRMWDYASLRDPHFRGGAGGGGREFEQMFVNELCPDVENMLNIRTSASRRAIGGASLGALSSISMGVRFPEQFTRFMLMSPSLFWANHHWLTHALNNLQGARMWLDCGDSEAVYPGGAANAVTDNLKFFDRLTHLLGSNNVAHAIGQGHEHNERAWGERVEHALKFLFAKNNNDISLSELSSEGPQLSRALYLKDESI